MRQKNDFNEKKHLKFRFMIENIVIVILIFGFLYGAWQVIETFVNR